MKYKDLQKLISKKSLEYDIDDIQQTEKLLFEIIEKLDLFVLINSIIDDENYLKEISVFSYSHDLGFDKIVIVPYKNTNYQLRFNIWWNNLPQNEITYEDIHNHRWDFSTYVLMGSYKYENFRKERNGLLMNHYDYYPTKNGKHALEFTGKKCISLFASGTLNKGEFMTVKNDILHKIEQTKEYSTITLFLTTKPKLKKVSVYKPEKSILLNDSIIKPNMDFITIKAKLLELRKIFYML
jgi:hypothetical protein